MNRPIKKSIIKEHKNWWSRGKSNSRPDACKAPVLPTELLPHISNNTSPKKNPSDLPDGFLNFLILELIQEKPVEASGCFTGCLYDCYIFSCKRNHFNYLQTYLIFVLYIIQKPFNYFQKSFNISFNLKKKSFYCKADIEVAFERLINGKGLSYYGTGSDLNLAHGREDNCLKYEKLMDKEYDKVFKKMPNCYEIDMNRSPNEIFKEIKGIISDEFSIGKYKNDA